MTGEIIESHTTSTPTVRAVSIRSAGEERDVLGEGLGGSRSGTLRLAVAAHPGDLDDRNSDQHRRLLCRGRDGDL